MFQKVYAQESLGKIGGTGLGPFGTIGGNAAGGVSAVASIVSGIIGLLTVCATIWFLIQLLVGGISWISSGGDKNSLENARNRIVHAFVGLIIIVAGWSIVAIIGQFLGYDVLLNNPGNILNSIQIQ